jgi:hypothetical protein
MPMLKEDLIDEATMTTITTVDSIKVTTAGVAAIDLTELRLMNVEDMDHKGNGTCQIQKKISTFPD